MSKENGNTIMQNGSKIDAIKEIIFGQTMQEYEERFANLEVLLHNKLNAQKKDSDHQLKSLQKDIDSLKLESEQKIGLLEKKLVKQIELLSDAKADKKVLKKYLMSLIENL